MRKVINLDGHQIGQFDCNTVRDHKGKIIYWISDNEVFSLSKYEENDLQTLNKGQAILVGKYNENQCFDGDKTIFKIT